MIKDRELYKEFGRIYGVNTKKEGIEFIRKKIYLDDLWLKRGLIAIYSRQTEGEKTIRESVESNGVGFSKYHAARMSEYATILLSGGCLTTLQMYAARMIMMGYSGQLYNISIETLRRRYYESNIL